MRILVCGGRNYNDQEAVDRALDAYVFGFGVRTGLGYVIIHGAASGADTCAREWALRNGISQEEFHADWKKYGRRAGYIRNNDMLHLGKPDIVLAFPGGKGTAMMVGIATKAGVRVIQMGSKGSSEVIDMPGPEFKTERYEKAYVDRIHELRGFSTPHQRHIILHELLDQEREWLDNMGAEYEEILRAQEEIDKLNGNF